MSTLDIARKNYSEPSFAVDLADHGQIYAVLFSPFEYSQDVILVAFSNKILAAAVNIQDNFEFKELSEFEHPVRCNAIALSPETCLSVLPSSLLFCTAGYDFKLRVFKSDLKESTCKVLSGHKDYINDISFDPENNYLASVSDDHTAKIWSTDFDDVCVASLLLTSAGISVHWHKDDSSKLLVAEKIGLIRFYNVDTQRPILSLDFGKPLSSAHWAPSDPQLVGSLQLGELLLWDLTRPSRPSQSKLIYTESGGHIRFNSVGDLVATVNQLDSTLKVFHVPSLQQRLSAQISLPTTLSWHYRYPIICIADDMKLCFWKVGGR